MFITENIKFKCLIFYVRSNVKIILKQSIFELRVHIQR